ncbi:MAG: tetratricopeptide repeat protein [Nitrospina sp.]|jgi:protein O-mannosyl-transferase|nr:tetratricopeptide repeat protein [Nitrospina sp.]
MTNNTRAQLFFSILGMFVLILIAYANTLFSPFNFDDQALLQQVILNDPNGYYQIWPLRYRHLLYFSFSFNHSLSGLDTFSYHLTNLLFHFFASVVVLLIVYKTLNNNIQWKSKSTFGLATATAFLFALNPLHTEAITYISGRASSIGGFFYLLALLFFILGSERIRNPRTTLPLYYFLALLAFSLALLTKETTLSFPFAVILYDLCFMRNECWQPFKSRLLFIYLPLAILISAFFILSPPMRNLAMGWFDRIDFNYALAQAGVLMHACKLFLFPINLSFDYDLSIHRGPITFSRFIPVAIWGILALATLKNFRRISPVVVFAFLWFLITISPTNSFLPREDLLSERNLYLPSLGLTFLIAFIFYHLFYQKSEASLSKTGLVLLVLFVLFQSSLLISRNSVYRSNILLWEDTYKKSSGDLKVLHNLSHYYLEDKRYQQALVPLLKLSRSEAGDFYRAFASSNLGSIYTQSGNFSKAEKEFRKAIKLEPSLPLGYMNLGTFYASRGEFRQARTEFLLARDRYLKLNWGYPMPVELELNLARVNWRLKSYSDAKEHILQYLQKVPDSSDGLLLLGKIYQEEGENKQAEKTYQKIQGGGLASAKAYNNLGILFIKNNQLEKAQEAFNTSINFYPQIPDAYYNFGKLILDSNGNRKVAQKYLTLALRHNKSPSLKEEINLLLEKALSP